MSLPVDPLAAVERVCLAEEVASVARHELRNRLASVRNASFYIMRRVQKTDLWQSDARVPQFFGFIEDAVVGADEIVEQRLQMAALYPRVPEAVSLRACVDRAVACARVAAPVGFEVDVRDAEVEADRDELALAIRCILENAAEASPTGATVRIVGADVPGGPASRRGSDDEGSTDTTGWHELLVTDVGPGIPEPARNDVTRAFVGDKPGHAGLGLAMVTRILRRYKGELVISGGKSGAAVALVLPLAAAAKREEEAR